MLGVAVVISCICGLLTWPSAAADEIFIISSATKIGEIELGEYPQTYVGDSTNSTLLNAVKAGTLLPTGKKYAWQLDTVTELNEYSYGNQRVVYVSSVVKTNVGTANGQDYSTLLPYKFISGETITAGNGYFFKVEPIKWDLYYCGSHVVAVLQNYLASCIFDKATADWENSVLRNHLNNAFPEQAGLTNYLQPIHHYIGSSESDTDGNVVTDKTWAASFFEYKTINPAMPLPTDLCRALGAVRYDNNDEQTIAYLRAENKRFKNRVTYVFENKPTNGDAHPNGTAYSFRAMFVLNDATAQHVDNVVAPTCEKEGYTEHYWTINGKQYDYTKDNVTKLADHTWGAWETVTENTCVEDGERRHTCTVCGYTETEHVPANDAKHHYVTQDPVAPTCGHDGYTEHKCSVCGATYRDNITAALEHVWGDWHTTKEPTATATGTAERECELCHTTEQKTLPALGVPSGTTTPTPTDNNGGQGWLIFGIVAGGILVLGSVTISWLFLGLSRRKKQIA